MKRAHLMAACAMAALAGWTGGIAAGQTVFQTARPDFDPLGLRAGGFIFLPALTAFAEWQSNVYRTASDAVPDFVTRLQPSLSVESNWGADALRLRLDGDIRIHRDLPNEDVTDWSAALDHRLDVLRGARLYLSGRYAQEHEKRGSPDQDAIGAAAAPTPFATATLSARFIHDRGKLSFEAGAEASTLRFSETERTGLPPVDNGDRDRTDTRLSLRATYRFSPGYGAFVDLSRTLRRFPETPDRNGFDRDADWTTLRAGALFEVTRVLTGEAYAGYADYAFADPAFAGYGALDFGASLTWSPSPSTSAALDVRRTVEPTTLPGSSGALSTRSALTVEHEILRNVLASAEVSYATQDFRETARADETAGAALRVRYLLGRHAALEAGYAVERRTSSAPGAGYDDSRLTVSLRIQY